MLKGASTPGDVLTPGQEPELAPGVFGILFDLEDGIWIPFIRSAKTGQGNVGRFLDSLPLDRKVLFVDVISPILHGMLLRRGYVEKWVAHMDDGCEAMVREPREV